MFSKNLSRNLSTSLKRSAVYGGRHTAVLIPGDGIGPEMSNHLKNTFQLIKAPVDFEEINLNKNTWTEESYQNTMMAIKRSGGCIKGNIMTDVENNFEKPKNQRIRADLDLFANVIHAKSYESVETRHKDIDIYIIRENTEGEYAGLEHESVPGVVESLKIMSVDKVERIARFAFDFAVSHNRKKVTAVHKANIMKQGDGLFLRTCQRISKEYPDIEFNDMIVDNTCMQLVSNPWQFDVMVTPNLYGNIVSNVCCGLTGGAGMAAGQNYNNEINYGKNNIGLFETATRNTGESIMNKDVANPTASLMAGVKLLEYFKCYYHANLIRPALEATISGDNIHTADIGGHNSTSEFMRVFHGNLEKEMYRQEDAQE